MSVLGGIAADSSVFIELRRHCQPMTDEQRHAHSALDFSAEKKKKMSDKRTLHSLKLIGHVRDNKTLWDVRSEEYKLTERKPYVWKELADKLGSD
jgi:hypothetical protein